MEPEKSWLTEQWEDLNGRLQELRQRQYFFEADNIQNLYDSVFDVTLSEQLKAESPEVRKRVARDIIRNGRYMECGAAGPMNELLFALPQNSLEKLHLAELIRKEGDEVTYEEVAVPLYRQISHKVRHQPDRRPKDDCPFF